MSSVEVKRAGEPKYQRLDSDGLSVSCVIRASKKNVENLRQYLDRRIALMEACGETEGEIEFTSSLLGRINKSLSRKGNGKNGQVALGLNVAEIRQFGKVLVDYDVRLPSLMRAMVQITEAIGVNSRTKLSEVHEHCCSVLRKIESMPH